MENKVADIHFSKTVNLNYLLHVPEQAQRNPEKLWPTILFLHGLGESGNNPNDVLQHGLPRYITERPDFPFIVIAPQCPENTWWPELADGLERLLEKCYGSLAIDRQRLYLTGLSMGGFGSWYLASIWPGRFAAIAPVCGGGYWFHGFPRQVAALKNVPVWAFHGAKDGVVPLTDSEKLVNALRGCGGNVRFTIYPNANHDSWTETYNNPELYNWFLQHSITSR